MLSLDEIKQNSYNARTQMYHAWLVNSVPKIEAEITKQSNKGKTSYCFCEDLEFFACFYDKYFADQCGFGVSIVSNSNTAVNVTIKVSWD